jgi:ubiquinol-cytochrome c reductase cytochrome c subunit
VRVLAAAVLVLALAPPAFADESVVLVRSGAGLYSANCTRCHGPQGQGVQAHGPALKDTGALGADFYLRTGYMPLADPHDQPERSRPLFTARQLDELIAFVASLGHGPAIPSPQPQQGDVSAGMQLFTDHCAGCHQEVARGGYVTGARVPPLTNATARQVAEAVRAGPYLMPRFSERAISDTQLNDIIAYVEYAKHPADRGGWSLGDIGPWPEGMVTWLLAAVLIVFTCTLVGRRLRA